VRAHVGHGRGLSGCARGSCRRSAHLSGSALTGEAAPDLLGDVELAAGEGACPRDGIPRAQIAGSFRLEDLEHPVCAIRRPCRDDPAVGFAERLWRAHTRIVSPPRT
jgi:hypothetical protein